VLVAYFLQFTTADATISQFKSQSHTLIKDLVTFVRGLNDEDEQSEDLM